MGEEAPVNRMRNHFKSVDFFKSSTSKEENARRQRNIHKQRRKGKKNATYFFAFSNIEMSVIPRG